MADNNIVESCDNISIVTAHMSQLEDIKYVTLKTIKDIYPHYYPKGAVDFFLEYHNNDNIKRDIKKGSVYLLKTDVEAIGTVTVSQNEIGRLFVLSKYQGRGFGKILLNYAEEIVLKSYNTIRLSSSLPAKEIYLKYGYRETQSAKIFAGNGDYLCYDIMMKHCMPDQSRAVGISYDGRVFINYGNTGNSEVDRQTTFFYHQNGKCVWAEYSGGNIEKGFLIGFSDSESRLQFTYQHLNIDGDIRIGQCTSIPELMDDGLLRIHETWEWLNGDRSKGSSELIEIKFEPKCE